MTLRELRTAASLRQVDVAKKLDIDQTAVSLWENGKSKPSRKYHAKLCRLYACSLAELTQAIQRG